MRVLLFLLSAAAVSVPAAAQPSAPASAPGTTRTHDGRSGSLERGGVEFDALVLWGKDENFYEWSSADIIFLNVGAAWKPTDKLRVDARYQLQSFRRRTDNSIVGIRRIPRLKAEYQIARSIFVRAVGGNTLANIDEGPRTARLKRTVDGFFLKLSYLLRL